MTRDSDLAIRNAIALLSHYGFELRGYTAQELVNLWLKNYQPNWIRLGVIEALYQGRYKAVSVEQILAVWARRGQPIYRFTHEFERLISRKLPQNLTIPLDPSLTDLQQEPSLSLLTPSPPHSLPDYLDASLDNPPPTVNQDALPPGTASAAEFTELTLNSEQHAPEDLATNNPSPTYEADWARCEASKQPIHQFTPPPDASSFYRKLKAVVQQAETPTKVVTPFEDADESHSPQLGSE